MKTPRRPSAEKRLHRLIGLAVMLSAALPSGASDIATDIVISEVLPYPADGQAAFVELYNPTDQDTNLGGYALSTDDSRSPRALAGYIPAYGFYLVALAEEGWPAEWPAPDFVLPELKLAPLTSGLRLFRGEGEEPDMLGWGVAPLYWEGTPCNTPAAGESLER
ncbi:MAG TPA: lamin tail domain-containing protein, partial [Candidatus Coatesbacteria bacterium]|nr:lamin tail domain-containing protein [Candidatus Coatesbacteria bacterium]